MSEPELIINDTKRALQVLGPKIIATLELYKVNTEQESSVLPQALFVDGKELKALAHVITQAKQSICRHHANARMIDQTRMTCVDCGHVWND